MIRVIDTLKPFVKMLAVAKSSPSRTELDPIDPQIVLLAIWARPPSRPADRWFVSWTLESDHVVAACETQDGVDLGGRVLATITATS